MNDGFCHSFCSTPNKYNYLAFRNLLCQCVLPHQFKFWQKMEQSVSGLLAAQPVSLSFTQDKKSAAGDSAHLTRMPMNDSIVAGVVGDYSTLHVCIIARGDVDRCVKGLPSQPSDHPHFSLQSQLLHNNCHCDE